MMLESFINLDYYSLLILLLNLLIAMVLLVGVKYISALISNVCATSELSEKDNAAFGISLAGTVLALTIMITGVMSGENSDSLAQEMILLASYGTLGIILMAVSRFVFDRISMPKFSVKDAVLKGNVTVGIIDAGNTVASAIIIRAVMVWIETDEIQGFIYLLVGYLLSQIVMVCASHYRKVLFRKYHDKSMDEYLEQGNVAIAWRFIGFKIGVALAITAASSLVPYAGNYIQIIVTWISVAIIMMVLVAVLAVVIDKILLIRINTREEVDNQGNVAIGIIQFVCTVSVGIIIAVLVG